MNTDAQYIIGVGRLVKRKGFDTFIRALVQLDSRVEGIILGDGPEKEPLAALAKELGVLGRIHFGGYVTEEKKFQYLANADIFVLSSIHEGFGIVIQEAMQLGLPVVSTNHGGQVDIVKEGKNGFLIEVGQPAMMAEKVTELLNNTDLRKKMSAQNLEDVKKFNAKNIAKEYIDLV